MQSCPPSWVELIVIGSSMTRKLRVTTQELMIAAASASYKETERDRNIKRRRFCSDKVLLCDHCNPKFERVCENSDKRHVRVAECSADSSEVDNRLTHCGESEYLVLVFF